jgi:alpha-beta hydrolase superfamily lysophospholipase
MSRVRRVARVLLLTILVAAATFFAVRIYDIRQMSPLQLWHTHVPAELDVEAMDAGDWAAYLAAEDQIFQTVRTEVTDKLPADARTSFNRYYDGSVVYPAHYARDWNRSYVLEPDGPTVGAVVLLHGLTDSPYSLRHVARRYAAAGFVAVAIRLPGHGTVPAGLSRGGWEDWMAATRLAVREARRRTAPSAPLHLVGFSNGGALAVKFALDALENPQLARPDRLILVSPMIGITRFARLAGVAGWPAVLPGFARAAWLSIVPEFNPFKYNSFPVNGGRQSYRLTRVLQDQIARMADANTLNGLAPILTFQSVLDFTVSTRAIVSSLYAYLPVNGSELVLFDVNRSVAFGQLLRRSSEAALARTLPDPPQAYRITVVGNDVANPDVSVVRTTGAGEATERVTPLDIRYPPEIFSMSHVSIPFPLEDPLYGLRPDTSHEDFGVQLGTLAPRGERGALVVNMDFISRVSSNPFFPFILERIEQGIRDPQPRVVPTPSGASFKKDPHRPTDAEIEEYLADIAVETAGSAGLVVP